LDVQLFNTETSSAQVVLNPKLNEVCILNLKSQVYNLYKTF